MLAADFGTCVSDLEKKVLTFGKEAAMNNQPMPVTIKSFPSVYFEKDSYEGHNYNLFWTEFRTLDGLDNRSRSGIMMEELLLCDAGELTGRVYGVFLDRYSAMEPYNWPHLNELKDFVIGAADDLGEGFRSVIFSVYEIEEHTADYLRGVLRWYKYVHDGHQLEHQAGDDEGIVILLRPNDR